VIFVTVGTHHQPFERLMRGLAALPGEELVVQHGPAVPPPGARFAAPYLSFPEMLRYFDEADRVVTHAGVGSILCATNAGHLPVVVPRLKRHDEHVDDHQVQLIRELGAAGKVLVVWDVADLADVLDQVPPRRPPRSATPGPIHDAVRAALRGGSPPVLPAPRVDPAGRTPAPSSVG
jgi:UDP-N-acetylglucosamine transferase subunit ALG13